MAKPLRVLMVEDCEDDALLLLGELRRGGYDPAWQRVDTVEKLCSALDRGSWQIVLADLSLSGFGGLEALAQVRARGLDLPFVVVSGTMDEDAAVSVMRAGANDFLAKDRLSRLVPVIERELREAEERQRRREAEAERQESEERFRRALEFSPIAMALVSLEGRFLRVNRVLCEMLGYSEEEMLGRTFQSLTHPEDLEGSLEIRRALLEGRTPHVQLEKRYLHKSGRVMWGLLSTAVVRDGGGKPLYFVSHIQNITKRHEAEAELERRVAERTAELRESEDRWRSLVAHIPDIILTLDRAGTILSINRTVPGLTPESVIGTSAYGYVDPPFVETVRESVERVFRTGEPDSYEARSLGAWWSTRVGPIKRDGQVVGVTMITTDVTERKSLEEDMRLRKTLLECQGEASPDGILVVSADGRMLSFNRRFVEMWGIPDAIVRGGSDEAALNSVLGQLEDPEAFLRRVRYLYDHRDEHSREEIRLKDGRVFDRHSAPVRDREGHHYGRVWFFRDVTEQKRTEASLREAVEATRNAYEALKRTQNRLIQAEKLASLGMVMAGVAHEINNPLNVIYGNLFLLREEVRGKRDPRRITRMLKDAQVAAEDAKRVIEEFRHFARERRAAEPCDLRACVRAAVAELRPMCGSRIRIRTQLEKLPPARVFEGQLRRAVQNLIKNAIQSIQGKGVVNVRLGRRGKNAVLEVKDTGAGIPRELLSKIFEPFFSTKNPGESFGLGLALAAAVVQNHGGDISVRSRVGTGSAFTVRLPLLPR